MGDLDFLNFETVKDSLDDTLKTWETIILIGEHVKTTFRNTSLKAYPLHLFIETLGHTSQTN